MPLLLLAWAAWRHKRDLLTSMPGIGPGVASGRISDLPELGSLSLAARSLLSPTPLPSTATAAPFMVNAAQEGRAHCLHSKNRHRSQRHASRRPALAIIFRLTADHSRLLDGSRGPRLGPFNARPDLRYAALPYSPQESSKGRVSPSLSLDSINEPLSVHVDQILQRPRGKHAEHPVRWVPTKHRENRSPTVLRMFVLQLEEAAYWPPQRMILMNPLLTTLCFDVRSGPFLEVLWCHL